MSFNLFRDAKGEADRATEMLVRFGEEEQGRHRRAATVGYTLAEAVAGYLEDPQGVGTDTLTEAYQAFMSQHSGDFAPPMADV
jgi:hypothetical protein